MNSNRKGIAVVVVIFFAFAIGIIMFTMLQSNTNLSSQTKQTIYAMQAYYLAHSCMQFGKLQISLLPKEIYDYYDNGANSGNALLNSESSSIMPMAMENGKFAGYDLFKENKAPDDKFPYNGAFKISKLEYVPSNDDMKMVQDSYRLSVMAKIQHDDRGDKQFIDTLDEEFIVSRYSGR